MRDGNLGFLDLGVPGLLPFEVDVALEICVDQGRDELTERRDAGAGQDKIELVRGGDT